MNEYHFKINGNDYNVNLKKLTEEEAVVDVNGSVYNVNISHFFKQTAPKIVRKKVIQETIERPKLTEAPGRDLSFNIVKSPLPGVILDILVKDGQEVKAGQTIIKMEAMKMENEIHSPLNGKVQEIFVKVGESVLESANLIKIA